MHVSMHVENEANGEETYLRRRANTDVSTQPQSKPSSEGLPETKDDLLTPTNQRLNSDDSGYLSPILNSDPDWYLRPRKLSTDTLPKKTYKSTKPSVLTQTRRMFLTNSRPNFRGSRRWLTTEAVLGGLLFAILVASIGFTALISVRFHESKQQGNLSGKYKSIEFARQQRNNRDFGRKDVDLMNKVDSRESRDEKTPSPLSKTASSKDVSAEKPQHFPREPREGQLVNYEHDAMPKLPEATKKKASKDLIESIKVPNEPDSQVKFKAVKKKSKKNNPLTKSLKKPKMSSASAKKQESLPSLDYDKDPPSFRGLPEPRNMDANDYEEDPSTFRGNDNPKEIQDTIDHDYEQDPSTFRGKQDVEFTDYESDPSTFRGKQEPGYSEAEESIV